jgi:hypothetical protein
MKNFNKFLAGEIEIDGKSTQPVVEIHPKSEPMVIDDTRI